jgi:hypothetical protein
LIVNEPERTAKRLKDAFFGKPQPLPLPPEPDSIPPLSEMLSALLPLETRVFGRYTFARDPLRGKFSPAEMDTLTAEADACGRETAKRVAAEHGNVSPEDLARAFGVDVTYPNQPTGTDRVTFAQFTPPHTIEVFQHSLEKAAVSLEEEGVRDLMGDVRIEDVLLAHELFHVIEEKLRDTIYTRMKKVELWAPWPFHNRSTIRSLSEIAGMAFARELTALPFSPFVLDVFLVYGYAPAAAFRLYEEISELAMTI